MLRPFPLIGCPLPDGSSVREREVFVQDLLWIAIMIGLAAVTLAYVRLCDNA